MNGNIYTLLAAMRVQRSLTAIATMLVPIGFAGVVAPQIYVLFAVCMLLYGAAGIKNAEKDNDYPLPSYSDAWSLGMIAVAFALSLTNKWIFLAFALWVVLGAIYNTKARRVMNGDATLLAITHHALPAFIASLILGLDILTATSIGMFMFLAFWTIIHLKNLKDTEDDRKRGYKTLTTERKDGVILTRLSFEISLLIIFLAYFFFGLDRLFLIIFSGVMAVKIIITYLLDIGRPVAALNFTRLMAILFLSGIALGKSRNPDVLLLSLSVGVVYLGFLVSDMLGPVLVKWRVESQDKNPAMNEAVYEN